MSHANARWKKSAEKKHFCNTCCDIAGVAVHETSSRSGDIPLAASGPVVDRRENNWPKVLTLEKTVIRFRAADMTCGRE
jgi:hypothetical protein